MTDPTEFDYEPEFEEYSVAAVDRPSEKHIHEEQMSYGANGELGTLTWTWTPLSRDALLEANDALVTYSRVLI